MFQDLQPPGFYDSISMTWPMTTPWHCWGFANLWGDPPTTISSLQLVWWCATAGSWWSYRYLIVGYDMDFGGFLLFDSLHIFWCICASWYFHGLMFSVHVEWLIIFRHIPRLRRTHLMMMTMMMMMMMMMKQKREREMSSSLPFFDSRSGNCNSWSFPNSVVLSRITLGTQPAGLLGTLPGS